MNQLILLLVVGSSIWVYADAKSIGARKGLTTGFFDLGPGGWCAACLLLWIVAFPVYLGKRKQIADMVKAANGGVQSSLEIPFVVPPKRSALASIGRALIAVGVGVIGFAVILLFAAYYLSNAITSSNNARTDLTTVSQLAEPALTVADWEFARGEYGNVSIVGHVKNSSGKQYSYAQVTFNLYDKSGSQVGTALANINNLEAGGTWKFEAGVLQDSVKTAKLASVTGF